MAYVATQTVQNVIDRVSQDLRLQLESTVGATGVPILIDYTNRIHQQMLRFSRWNFILSETLYFMTAYAQTDYWLGPSDACPTNCVNTGLNLIDVDVIAKNTVRDFSNNRPLGAIGAQPIGPNLNFRSGQTRPNQPAAHWQDRNDPNILHIFPGSDNSNSFSPVPNPPIMSSVVGGGLAQRTYFYQMTFVDSLGGESNGSSTGSPVGSSEGSSVPNSGGVSWTIPAGSLGVVFSPGLDFDSTSSGVIYSSWNLYAGLSEGALTKQNAVPMALGTNWTEPTSGLTTTGPITPTSSTLAPMGGYIIAFRYFKDRVTLTNPDQEIQIPDYYVDVLIDGVSALGWKFLQRADDAQACQALFKQGLTSMVWDKNLFPANQFIRPDPATFVNQQILGYLPPDF